MAFTGFRRYAVPFVYAVHIQKVRRTGSGSAAYNSVMEIRRLNPKDPHDEAALKEIFFLSAARSEWPDPVAKENFYQTWTSYYLKQEPDLVFLAVDGARVLAYLTGSRDSLKSQPELEKKIKSFNVFADLFQKFPAHLHINAHPDARGLGVGSALISHFVDVLRVDHIHGVHLVTSPDARNVKFYRDNGFNHETVREFKTHKLLFMGRVI